VDPSPLQIFTLATGQKFASFVTGAAVGSPSCWAEVEVAVNQFVEPGKRADTFKLLPLSRDHLELCASRGRNLAAYTARKAQLDL